MTGHGAASGRSAPDWDSALPEWAGTARWRFWRGMKRLVDIGGAFLGLVLSMPLMLVLAVLIRLDSRGPVLHRMHWIGTRGREFFGYKFRTMVPNAEALKSQLEKQNEMSGPVFKMKSDPRVTRVGRFLRKTSLDELPQLWSVLKGDMSLVGPRPPGPHEYAQFEEWHKLKMAVIPGITCTWQVSGRSRISDFDTWVRMDLAYIKSWTFWADVSLLLRTVPAVLFGRGAA